MTEAWKTPKIRKEQTTKLECRGKKTHIKLASDQSDQNRIFNIFSSTHLLWWKWKKNSISKQFDISNTFYS